MRPCRDPILLQAVGRAISERQRTGAGWTHVGSIPTIIGTSRCRLVLVLEHGRIRHSCDAPDHRIPVIVEFTVSAVLSGMTDRPDLLARCPHAELVELC